MSDLVSRRTLGQFLKYGAVGVLNTLLTALIIYLCQEVWGLSPVASNVIGYAAGLINSFAFNSRWTFQSNFSWRKLGGFLTAFGICYLIQLGVLLLLDRYTEIAAYPVQLMAMAVYTVVNFLLNKLVVFKK